jgi:hypothetical protein
MNKEQFIRINEYVTKHYYSDREMKISHREDGPAVEYVDGGKEWYLNGKRHREDGPAIEYADGRKAWYINGERHREDGPAVEHTEGYKAWFINGELHREDGPAVEDANGFKAWYLNDKRLTEEKFNARMNPVTELTLDEIAEKFGIEVNKLKIKK